jgi:hypothetical protein
MEQTFQKSESIINLTKALMLFSIKIGKIKKENKNPFFHSLYADLPAIQDAIADPLQESGLVVTQLPCGDGLITMLAHAETGEYIMANSVMKPIKSDPQSIGSAITYQRRYSLAALLNLNIDKDDDGNAASQPSAPQPQADKPEKPWLNKFADKEKTVLSKQWNDTILKIQGGTPLTTVKQYFKLSKENETELQTYIK